MPMGAILEWTIQRNWQLWVHKTQDVDKQTISTTQNVLDTNYASKEK